MATSNGTEWEIDESLEELTLEDETLEAIVVAIDHGNEERNNEYNVYFNEEYQFGGKGEYYIAFLVETLKPFIDNQYRTLPEPESTIIAGSSFGAYISLYAAVKHQDVFGKVDVVREGKHHEDTWKGLFPVAFKWLLQKQ